MQDKMPQYCPLAVRDCQGTLWSFYRHFQGQGAASFEGDLSGLSLGEIPGSTDQETSLLKRQTIFPRLDFCVVPIDAENIELLKDRLSANGVLGRAGAVIHTQIAVANELILIACDNFHEECTVVSRSVPEDLLIRMKSRGLLRAYGGV